MAFNFERIRFEKQFEYLDNTKKWLKIIGINTANTRFDKIYNYNKRIIEHDNNNSLNKLLEEYDNLELSLALVDASSFINIYQAFKDEKSHIHPRAKLKKMLKGPYYSWEEDPLKGDNESRNILFELETAAFFKKAGVEIIGFDDVDFNFEETKFNVQCKRIFSEKKIEENISESANQFTKRMESQGNIKGIICLSIDKLMAKEQLVFKVKTLNEIKNNLGKLVIEFSGKYKHLWNGFLNINILAVFLFFHAVSILEDEPHDLLINSREIEGNIITSHNFTQFHDDYLIEKLKEKVESVK
jgi:hypothetical protein